MIKLSSTSTVIGIEKSPFASDDPLKLLKSVPFQICASKPLVTLPVPVPLTNLLVIEVIAGPTNSDGDAAPAVALELATGAEMVVVEVGQAVDNTGRALMSGHVSNVPVETGLTIDVGDILYLSDTEAGKVTNVRTVPVRQVVGRCVTGGNSSIPISILFFPRDVHSLAITGTIEPGDWSGPVVGGDFDGEYFEEIDITPLDVDSTHPTVLINVFDDADDQKISPAGAEVTSAGNGIKIYSPSNAFTWNYILSSGGGSVGTAGGGGTNDHSILLNLDFASAGHTGFAANPHGNAQHSSTFIEATDVTFANLDANGDVGDAASTVSEGDHTHELGDTNNYNDVPSGEIILFEKDTAVAGYSLLTTVDDQLVYITKGSGAGGDAGGSTKTASTWSQPNHGHPTGNHTLTIAEMPAHTHNNKLYVPQGIGGTNRIPTGDGTGVNTNNQLTDTTGGGSSHSHGWTSGSATESTWRPLGRNMTRQQRI